MSADLLREAAALMRERAEDAVLATGEGSWQVAGPGWVDPHGSTYTVKRGIQTGVCEALTEEQAEHIASWHPAVALAVADWLEAEAGYVERNNLAVTFDGGAMFPPNPHALAVARTYLGRQP